MLEGGLNFSASSEIKKANLISFDRILVAQFMPEKREFVDLMFLK
jgi:hypothetical protein